MHENRIDSDCIAWGDYTVCEKLMHQEETKEYRERIYPITKEGEEICLKIS